MKIQQVIVVEGEHDRRAILAAVEAEVEITGGFALTEDLIQRLQILQERRGLILMTDPDYTGEVIRRTLQRKIPGVQHAYLSEAESEKNGDIGVENANPEAIRRALLSVRSQPQEEIVFFTMQDLYHLKLTGHADSAFLRKNVSSYLKIGYGNGKKFFKQLNMYQITPQQLAEALQQQKVD